eukprot:jgi/Galph1/4746/GphlegSOOS_G3405.1
MAATFYPPFAKPLNKSSSSPYFTENCVVCLENVSTIELRPCGHAIICQVCVSRLDDGLCPFCRRSVEVIRVRGAKELYPFTPKTQVKRPENSEKSSGTWEKTVKVEEVSEDAQGQESRTGEEDFDDSVQLEVPFLNILEERRAFESFVYRRTYQVLISGNLSAMRMEELANFVDQRPTPATGLYLAAKNVYGDNFDGQVPLHSLVDTTSSAETYLCNLWIKDRPFHIQRMKIWELIRTLRHQKRKRPDLFILCCSAFSKNSLDELLALDEMISSRLAMFTCRIWVFLDVASSEKEARLEKSLTFDQVQEAYYKVPIHRRASKLLHLNEMSAENMSLIGDSVVSLAKQFRRLETSQPTNKFCCFM